MDKKLAMLKPDEVKELEEATVSFGVDLSKIEFKNVDYFNWFFISVLYFFKTLHKL